MSRKIIFRIDRDLARRLVQARVENGLSTRSVCEEVSKSIPISHSTLASYERGETSPSMQMMTALSIVYNRPVEWFRGSSEALSGFRYRNLKSRVRLNDQRQFEASASKWVDAYVSLEERLGQKLKNHFKELPPIDTGTNPVDLARQIRKMSKLADTDPIFDTVELVESLGVRVIELPTTLEIDGMTARRGSAFVVVLNPRVSPDRLRLNVAHELAHVLYDDCKNQNNWTDDLVEKRAYEFGSHLLLPDSQLHEAFKGQSFVKLKKYKEKFGISIAAMIFRAERQKIIPSKIARWLWVKMNQKGWRKQEPGKVRRDLAHRFESLLEQSVETNQLTWDDAERITGIRQNELKARLEHAILFAGKEAGGIVDDATSMITDDFEME